MSIALPKFTPISALPKYRTRFVSHTTPTSAPAGQTLTVTLSIQNTGSTTWVQGGSNPVRLGFKWFDASGNQVTLPPQFDYRTPLTRDVAPNSIVVLRAQLRTPDRAGRYQLRWDLVHEGITWFIDQGDAGLLVSPLQVNPVAAAPSAPPARTTPATPASPAPTPAPAPAPAAPTPAPVHVQIQNVIESLARHPSKQYTNRAVTDIRRVIIHHTATPATVTVDRIAQFLVSNRDLPGITYHFCITAEGVAYQTQPLVVTSVHAGQDSRDSVGICLIGNFTDAVPPQAQLYAAASVVAQLLSTLNLPPDRVVGYNEIASTASPGNTWPTWKPQILAQVQAFLGGAPTAAPTTAPTPPAPAQPQPTAPAPTPAAPAMPDKPIYHYLLLWHKGAGNWAEWDLRATFDYLERFPATIGFSVEEAKRAKYVTILGGPEGVPSTAEETLRAAGCQVERLAGASEPETRQILRNLAQLGKRFQQLQ